MTAMGVEFDAGSFTNSPPNPNKLTEFVLDRTVDIVLGLQVDQNDGGFILGLVLRTPGGTPEWVKSSTASFVVGASVEIRFDAVPAGIYSIVVQSLDGTVAGTYRARWENILDVGSGPVEGIPVNLPAEPQFGEFEPIPHGVPVVPVVSVVAVVAVSPAEAQP
ncbi:hypothetical protein ACFQZZ_22005 [Nocardia sp. GCM10030253]|uniref:hypothetical protein n=1 Tax=Nocardia sp. GCM10030253 TaxID=3273404 RepID=UPI00362A523F